MSRTPSLLLAVLLSSSLATAADERIPDMVSRVKAATVIIIGYDKEGHACSQGTGFFISLDQVLTNRQSIKDCASLKLRSLDGRTRDVARLVAENEKWDLAILSVGEPDNSVKPLTLSTAYPRVGEHVVVVSGTSFGSDAAASEGLVSAIRDVQDNGKMLEIKVPVSLGPSGDPVLNLQGDVVGVTNPATADARNTGSAVPSARITELIAKTPAAHATPYAPKDAASTSAKSTPDSRTMALYAKCKCKYALMDGKYIRLPDFDLRYENSRGSTRLPERAKYTTVYHTEQVTRRTGGTIVLDEGRDPRKHEKPVVIEPQETVDVEVPASVRLPDKEIAELDRIWHTELPDLRVGEFGFWPANERLSTTFVLGPDDVLLSSNGVTFRLKGVDTRDMKEGDEVKVLKTYVAGSVAVVETNADSSGRSSGSKGDNEWSTRSSVSTKSYDTVAVEKFGAAFSIAIIGQQPVPGFGEAPLLLAVPMEHVRRGLSLEQFVEILNSGIDPEKGDTRARR